MLSLIVAIAENDVIGGDNKLLWHLSEDLKRFKEITMNKTIIMGRKTFESLPKVLPGRKHIVITRDNSYAVDSDQVEIVHSLDEIISKFTSSNEECFIIGGGEIYKMLLPHCNKLYLTKIYSEFKGDTYLPIDFSKWNSVFSSGRLLDSKSNIPYEFINYIRC